MNSGHGKAPWSEFPGAGRAGSRTDRRKFSPSLDGLEGRQLLSASGVSTVVSLQGSNAATISPLVTDAQGNLYGTASNGGSSIGKGESRVFEIASGSKKATTLASFDGLPGYGISGLSVDPQGDVFGTFSGVGSAVQPGSVFEIAHGSKTVTKLATFDQANDPFPSGVTVDAQGNLFGTDAVGGANGSASVFEVAQGSNTVTTLANYAYPGAAPKGLVMDAQGNLYGTNAAGDSIGTGTIFEIPRGTNTVENLAAFPSLDGAGLSKVTVDAQGNLYGTTEDGGLFGVGSIFEIARGSNTVTTLASFDSSTGTSPDPASGVVMDAQGNLYGTTYYGGTNNEGTIYEVAKGSTTPTTLSSLGGINGQSVGSLKLDGQGNLLGTVNNFGGGSVFKLKLS